MYHRALTITFPTNVNLESLSYNEIVYDFFNCNYNVIRSSLAIIDWSQVFDKLCINNAVDTFYKIIFRIIDDNCLKKNFSLLNIRPGLVRTEGLSFLKKNST